MKKLLNKILPRKLLVLLVKYKYKKYNYQMHSKNIIENKIVAITFNNREKYNFLKSLLVDSFGGTMKVGKFNFYFYPVAIIKVPKDIEEYLKLIGAKSRNMNKKAQKSGIKCRIFNWNEYLDDIYEINRSSSVRQGREMDSSYKEYPKKVKKQDSDDFRVIYIGAFKDEKLVGYIELYIYGNFAMINRILGHKEYLKFGIMNLLMKTCVEYSIDNGVEYINYLTMMNRNNNSLSAFKYRVGFREYSLLELK